MEWQDGQERAITVEGEAGGKPYKVNCNLSVFGLNRQVVEDFNEALADAIVKEESA